MKCKYKLIKWNDTIESFYELDVTIQEEAVEDFKDMCDWDDEEFAHNTIRYPVIEKEIPKEKKKKVTLFPEEAQEIIRKNYEIMTDKELRAEIGDQLEKYYTIEQIKEFRKKMDWNKNAPLLDDDEDILDALED